MSTVPHVTIVSSRLEARVVERKMRQEISQRNRIFFILVDGEDSSHSDITLPNPNIRGSMFVVFWNFSTRDRNINAITQRKQSASPGVSRDVDAFLLRASSGVSAFGVSAHFWPASDSWSFTKLQGPNCNLLVPRCIPCIPREIQIPSDWKACLPSCQGCDFAYVDGRESSISIESIEVRLDSQLLHIKVHLHYKDVVSAFRVKTSERIPAGALDSCTFHSGKTNIVARKHSEGFFQLTEHSLPVTKFTLKFKNFWYSHKELRNLRDEINQQGISMSSQEFNDGDFLEGIISFGETLRSVDAFCVIHYRDQPIQIRAARESFQNLTVNPFPSSEGVLALQFVRRKSRFRSGRVTIDPVPALPSTLSRFIATARGTAVVEIVNQAFLFSDTVQLVHLFTGVDNPRRLRRIRMRVRGIHRDFFMPLVIVTRSIRSSYAEVEIVLPDRTESATHLTFFVDSENNSFSFSGRRILLLSEDNRVLRSMTGRKRHELIFIAWDLEVGNIYRLRIVGWRHASDDSGFYAI